MRRRDFIKVIAGLAAAWPLSARAQTSAGKIYRLGILQPGKPPQPLVDILRDRLKDLGYREGRNIAYEYRWAEGKADRLDELAKELVDLKVDVITTLSTPAAIAAKKVTKTIPIVFSGVGDPVGACSRCKDGVTVALVPQGPITKGLAAPGLLTHVVVSKYVDHVPLARLTTIFARLGIDIPRQTLCGWVEKIHQLLALVEAAQWRSVLSSHVLGADETPVNVLEDGRKQCARGYLWCYVGDQDEVVFDFSMGRGSETPLRALKEYVEGVLVCDAYAGYDELDRTRPQLVRSGCMAHARRKVFEAKEGEPDRALILLALIRQLYDHEALIQEAVCTTRHERHALALAVRQEKSRPVMTLIEEHVTRYRDQVLPKSPMGKALGYLTNQWTPLSRFLEDGAIPIDNNPVERQIRPIAVGRGNWTFIGSEDAGPWAARLYGLMGTCKMQGINPYTWLKDVLERVRDHPPDRIHELTPRGWKLARGPGREAGP